MSKTVGFFGGKLDTEAIVTLRFLVEYNGVDSELLRQIANEQQYDLWLFLEDDVVFVDDGTRGYVNDRNNSTYLLKQLLKEHRVKYISIKGSFSERLSSAMKEVDKLLR